MYSAYTKLEISAFQFLRMYTRGDEFTTLYTMYSM